MKKKIHLAILVLLDFFVVEKKYADVKKSYNVANWNIVFIFQIKKATGWLARHTNMFQLIIQCHSSATRTRTHTHTRIESGWLNGTKVIWFLVHFLIVTTTRT